MNQDDRVSVVVSGASTSMVQGGGLTKTISFKPGVSSTHIVNASLDSIGLKDKVPPPAKEQIIENINKIETYARNPSTGETTNEFSFQQGLSRVEINTTSSLE